AHLRVCAPRAAFLHSLDPERSSELLVSGHSRSRNRTITPQSLMSTAFEIRLSDWPALRRGSVLSPLLPPVPRLHQTLSTLRFEPRVIAHPPDWRIRARGGYSLVSFQYQ